MESPQSLTLELLDLICAEYNEKMGWVARGRKGAHVQVSCPLHDSHTVSGYGFILLEDCEGTLGSADQHLVSIFEGERSMQLDDFQLPSVSSRLSRQPRTMERIQFSGISLRNKDLVDIWLNVLQNCDEAHGLRSVHIYDDIGTGGWEALAKALRLHQPYMLRFSSYNNVMMHARSEDLRIIWDAMLEGSRFEVEIRDVVTETRVGATKEFLKGSVDAETEKKWTKLLKCWEAAKTQAERRRCLRPRTADFNPFGENTKIW